jgi:branched-chain amino acid transport system permease protein
MDIFLQNLINALSLGGIYALLALGLALVFSIMGLINFAHGELTTMAAYGIVLGNVLGLPFLLAVALGIAFAGVGAVAMERVAFRPVRGASAATLLLTSFAISAVLQVLFQNLIAARPLPVTIPRELTGTIQFAGLRLGVLPLVTIVGTALLLGALTLFLRKTTIGIAMRAAAIDFDMTRLVGIRANAVIAVAFLISGLLAGIAAVFWVAQRGSVDPMMGFLPVLKAFIAVILGGLGSLTGAVAGAFLLAFVEVGLRAVLSQDLMPFREAMVLAIVIVVLLVRPHGLFGKAETVR